MEHRAPADDRPCGWEGDLSIHINSSDVDSVETKSKSDRMGSAHGASKVLGDGEGMTCEGFETAG
eukprot:scaffold825_cov249-Pinguiococcus_pyrenoidosus.AAC.70